MVAINSKYCDGRPIRTQMIGRMTGSIGLSANTFKEVTIMKMKRLVSVLLAGAMALSLVACGGDTAPAAVDNAPAAEETKEEAGLFL